jgi:hypothetical protein
MLHITQSHCNPDFTFVGVSNRYMHTKDLKKFNYNILRNTRSKVKSEDFENITVLNILVYKVTGKGILLVSQ